MAKANTRKKSVSKDASSGKVKESIKNKQEIMKTKNKKTKVKTDNDGIQKKSRKNNPNKNSKQPHAEPIPLHYPVASSIPTNASTAGITQLKPGTILHNCNGKDIRLTKNSDSKPNFIAGRGRFLFILPGLMSLRNPAEGIEKDKAGNDKKESSNTLKSMGRIRGLETNQPVLTIPLPNAQSLELKGRKIQCSSKYLVLNCRSSGIINCKHLFQEMVVFGDYKIIREGDEEEKKSSIDDDNGAKKEDTMEKDCTFRHYGGSDRAVDGGMILRRGGRKPVLAKTNKSITASTKINSDCAESSSNSDCVESVSNKKKEGIFESTNTNKLQSKEIVEVEDIEKESDAEVLEPSDSDESVVFANEKSTPSQPITKRPSRSSTNRKAKYNFDSSSEEEEEEEEEEVEEEEDEVVEEEPKKDSSSSKSKGKNKKAKYNFDTSSEEEEEEEEEALVQKKGMQDASSSKAKGKNGDHSKRLNKTPGNEKNIIKSKKTTTPKSKTSKDTLESLIGSSPSARKRRKFSSPDSASKRKKKLNFTSQDDFIFLD